jgi:hypothetical protein
MPRCVRRIHLRSACHTQRGHSTQRSSDYRSDLVLVLHHITSGAMLARHTHLPPWHEHATGPEVPVRIHFQ